MAGYLLNLSDEAKTRWQTAATERGCSLAEFIRGCVEAELAGPGVIHVAPSAKGRKAPAATVPGGKVFKGMDPKGGKAK